MSCHDLADLTDPMFFLIENVVEEDTSTELSVGELLTRADRDLSKLVQCSRNKENADSLFGSSTQSNMFSMFFTQAPEADEPTLMGDIAMHSEKNADPCTATGCMWQKYSDGNIWVPYVIANHFCKCSLSCTFHFIC